jgi:hypothetical protein
MSWWLMAGGENTPQHAHAAPPSGQTSSTTRRAFASGQLATGSQGPRPSSSHCHRGHNSHRRIVRFDRRNRLLNRPASVARNYMNLTTSSRDESKAPRAIEKQLHVRGENEERENRAMPSPFVFTNAGSPKTGWGAPSGSGEEVRSIDWMGAPSVPL